MKREKVRRGVAKAIRKWRADGQLERERVSQHVGVSVRTVQRWEAADTEPNATDLILMEGLRPGIVGAVFAHALAGG